MADLAAEGGAQPSSKAAGGLAAAEVALLLPHRYPFLLVDRVLELEPGRRITAVKNVTHNEPFFPGHFPGYPVMPGVLMVEALAQAAAVCLAAGGEAGRLGLFAGLDGVRFRRQVFPGDTILLRVEVTRRRGSLVKASGRALVGDLVAVEAEELSFALVELDRPGGRPGGPPETRVRPTGA